jgi:predicted phosphodiesterase
MTRSPAHAAATQLSGQTRDTAPAPSSKRYAVLADIHANLHALESVLSVIPPGTVDGYAVAGDLVGYGPHPNECVDLIRALDCVCVVGNHDLIAVGQLPDEGINPLARETLRWTRRVLREDVRRYLANLPQVAELDGGVVVAHGALHDPTLYVREWRQAVAQVAELRDERPDARVLILGHTHRPAAWAASGHRLPISRKPIELPATPCVLNPGSVGQARALFPRAQFLLLDLERGEARFRRLRYDLRACRRDLTRAGLPPDACHQTPAARRAFAYARQRWSEATDPRS